MEAKNLEKIIKDNMEFVPASNLKVNYVEGKISDSYSLNIDSKEFIGSITFWPSNNYEFHFISCATGKNVILEEKILLSEVELKEFLKNTILKKLLEM
ncbi:MAG: hypothetical protein KA176_11610 [Alphaproteobacteria bacterium]|nr:hypothetical protein [Alphaproteobacteria bacterium]MBP7763208.1 hypothetical protein [Alphaproteobacteria bacterium]